MKARPFFVLASASPARLQTLRNAGIDALVQVAGVDEEEILARLEGESPATKVLALARAKAEAAAAMLSQSHPQLNGQEGYLVGCDSMLEFDGQVLGKPHTPQVAYQRVLALSGSSGLLHTGHWVIRLSPAAPPATPRQSAKGQVGTTRVIFNEFSEAEARAYVECGEPLEVAGSFTIDAKGGAFIAGIEGDPHNVVGISLPLLRTLTTELGAFWPDFWTL